MKWSGVKCSKGLRNWVSTIFRKYTDHMKFYCSFHILLVLLCIIVYMVVCFVRFCLILYIIYSYCYVCSVLGIVSLCCSMYCLCVNVYCTAATGWQPNCSFQIYISRMKLGILAQSLFGLAQSLFGLAQWLFHAHFSGFLMQPHLAIAILEQGSMTFPNIPFFRLFANTHLAITILRTGSMTLPNIQAHTHFCDFLVQPHLAIKFHLDMI